MTFDNLILNKQTHDRYVNCVNITRYSKSIEKITTVNKCFSSTQNFIKNLRHNVRESIELKVNEIVKKYKSTLYFECNHENIGYNEPINLCNLYEYIKNVGKSTVILDFHSEWKYKLLDECTLVSMDINEENIKKLVKIAQSIDKEIFSHRVIWLKISGFYMITRKNSTDSIEDYLNSTLIRYCLANYLKLPIRIQTMNILDIFKKETGVEKVDFYSLLKLTELEISYIEFYFKPYRPILRKGKIRIE